MKPKLMLILAFCIGFVGLSLGQAPNWGSSAAEAQEKYALFTDNVKMKDFKAAVVPLTWLLKNAPELGNALYIDATKTYEGLVDQTKDPKQLAAYQDSALLMYDLRLKYFKNQDEANILNRKGLKAYPYMANRPNAMDQLYPLYEKIIAMNGEQTYNPNVQYYMDLVCKKKAAGGLSDEQVLAEYDKVNSITEKNLAGSDAAKTQLWTTTKTYIDQLLQSCVTIDCNFVKGQLGPKFKQNPDDVNMAKRIFGLMATGKCTTDPLFLEAGEVMVKKEPSYGVYRVLAKIQESNKNYDKAAEYYEEAIKYANSGGEKADSYLEIAQINDRKGSNQTARNYYLKAAEAGKTSAYTSIGNLYLSSHKECTSDNPVKATLWAIAAYEMYQKAGDKANMAKARKYFPTAEMIFTHGMTDQIGKQLNTGCWINETVTLQKQ
jgi:tetratricopeptide (TPR) repeat protein